MKNQTVTLNITDLTPEGFGVARHGGKVVFVQNAAAGDIAEVLIVKELSSHCFGKITKLITPSPDRAECDCGVYEKCGSCSLRHITYSAELEIKRRSVEDALSRIGGLDVTVHPTESGKSDRYRNKVQYPFGTIDGRAAFGYFSPRSHRLVPHGDCLLQDRNFYEIASKVLELATESGISVYDEESAAGSLRHSRIRKSRVGEYMLCLVVTDIKNKKYPLLAKRLAEELPYVKSIYLNENKSRGNSVFGGKTLHIYGKEKLTDTLCGRTFCISPESFYQVNSDMAERLFCKARELAGLKPGEIVLDLYCGVGTVGLCIANGDNPLCGVEIIPQAIEDARLNAGLCGRSEENTLFVCGDASVGVAECKKHFGTPDLITVDPPRKGLEREVIMQTCAASPKRIVYISCNPATLARDLAIFAENGYFCSEATPFDLFPRTKHVESVVCLTRTFNN